MIKPLSDVSATAPPPPAARLPAEASAPLSQATADSAWITAAVDQFEVPLTQYATRLLSGDVDRARDVVQDTFLKLWTADRAGINGHLGQWLYRVCRNRALDVRRKEGRMTVLKDEQLEMRGARPSGIFGTREGNDVRGRQTPNAAPHELPGAAVMSLLETLNDTQQEALRLKFQGGLSYKEIADVMDITSNHVGVLIHHAIKALRERMAAHHSNQQQGIQPGRAPA